MKHILITRPIPQVGIDMLTAKGFDVTIHDVKLPLSQRNLLNILKKKHYDAVITHLTDKIDAHVFDSVPDITLYVNYATGFDNIDIAAAQNRGIVIAHSPADSSAEAVAEHTIALMLSLVARIVEADEYVRKGKYRGWSAMNFIGTDLIGKTLGLIGMGRIGTRVAHYAKGLNMKIIYTDLHQNVEFETEYGATYYPTADEVLRTSDVISLHTPLLDSTYHLIDAHRIKMMKKTAVIINTSRGAVIDEKALVEALKNGTIAGAALDVFEYEPKLTPGLRKLQNTILTPHIASASVEARNEMAIVAATNVIEYLEGKKPRHIVTQ
jgi:glyoxylate reductase